METQLHQKTASKKLLQVFPCYLFFSFVNIFFFHTPLCWASQNLQTVVRRYYIFFVFALGVNSLLFLESAVYDLLLCDLREKYKTCSVTTSNKSSFEAFLNDWVGKTKTCFLRNFSTHSAIFWGKRTGRWQICPDAFYFFRFGIRLSAFLKNPTESKKALIWKRNCIKRQLQKSFYKFFWLTFIHPHVKIKVKLICFTFPWWWYELTTVSSAHNAQSSSPLKMQVTLFRVNVSLFTRHWYTLPYMHFSVPMNVAVVRNALLLWLNLRLNPCYSGKDSLYGQLR